ncbi:MAG: hypothetical protein GF331_06945 [Chitinivibrionales bacterium]|nr:hypothetical protein [Chitinivibrionales bacterium]
MNQLIDRTPSSNLKQPSPIPGLHFSGTPEDCRLPPAAPDEHRTRLFLAGTCRGTGYSTCTEHELRRAALKDCPCVSFWHRICICTPRPGIQHLACDAAPRERVSISRGSTSRVRTFTLTNSWETTPVAPKRIAAIFDLDGTLIPHSSAEWVFFSHLLRKGVLTPFNLLQMLGPIWSFRGDLHAMMRGNKRYLRNKKVEQIRLEARRYFGPKMETLVFPEVRALIEEHRGKEDLLLLLSGSLDVIADCFVRGLSLDGQESVHLEVRDGRFTGRISGVTPFGVGKLEAFQNLTRSFDLDLNRTTLYANMYTDRHVLNAAATAVAVNPDDRLRTYAQRRKWEIVEVNKQ